MKYLLGMLMITGALSAAVEDGASLFSKAAVEAANKKLADVKTSTAKEILILTTNDLGGKSIRQYTRDEAMRRKLNGVIVVISTKPRMLEVTSGRKTSIIFTREKNQRVTDIFKANLRKNPDAALSEAVQFIYDVFKNANAAMIVPDSHTVQQPVQRRETSSSFGWLKWVFIGLFIFLIIRLIGYFMNRNASAATPGAPGTTPGGFGGGGFFSSMLGGIFGAVAGNWIYDKFFSDHEDRSYHAHDTRYDNNNDWRGDDNGDMGSSSGGDWGDSGGDSGGSGDSGGGDW